jgi:hypothetical protein
VRISSRDGTIVSAAFVDGGVSPFNDPSLQLLMLAALQGHGFRWQTGADKILLISVGTGTYKQTYSAAQIMDMPVAQQGIRALQSLMDDCARMNHAMVQWITDCLTPWRIDSAVGDMKLDSAAGPKLATSAHYDVILDQTWLKTKVEITLEPNKIAEIAEMDNATNMDELARIGHAAAFAQVRPEHFPPRFDVK